MPTFECAVCHAKKPEQTKAGPGFITAPNGARLCNACVDGRDRVEMVDKGQVTLYLAADGPDWFAVNRTGGLKYPLLDARGKQLEDLSNPSFIDPAGAEWRGRYYPTTRSVVFQRKRVTRRIGTGVPPTPPATPQKAARGRKQKTKV
jgi:hypothetical protein